MIFIANTQEELKQFNIQENQEYLVTPEKPNEVLI